MMRTQSPAAEKWIHSFAVTDVCLHPKKFTVYKITSVVFPINIPEALTCLTVWKRFNDIKALLKFIKNRHKTERLKGIVPTLNNHTFFKRFETDVITERKLFIIRLLDFVGQHPQLYKSQKFQDFFSTSQSKPTKEVNLPYESDEFLNGDTVDSATNIPSFRDDSTSSSLNASTSSSMSSPIVDSPDELISDDGYSAFTENEVLRQKTSTLDNNLSGEYSFRSPVKTPSAPNQREELSKFRVMKIINNVMQVQDVATNQVYVMKSIDKVFNEPEEFYLPTNFPFMVALVAYYVSDTTIYLLLAQATGGRLYDYIRSYNRHSSTTNRPLVEMPPVKPKPFISGNSMKSSAIGIPQTQSNALKSTDDEENNDNNFSFYDLLQSYYEGSPATEAKTNETELDDEHSYDEAPHFQLIANDLDVDNILNCSQKLLKSVSTTLKRVQTTTDKEPTTLPAEFQINYNDSIESLNESETNLDSTPPANAKTFRMNRETIKSQIENELFEFIDVSRLPRAIIRRWFREIIFAVKHLHANDILCYDLQPNNLLLGNSGEILLTYFYRREFDPYILDENMHQTCYPIPNIAPDKPLTAESDVWSIGVIFFELLTGYSFQSCHPNGVQSYFEIQYPENVELDTDSRDLIEGMLQTDSIQRTKLVEIEEHPFFLKSIHFS